MRVVFMYGAGTAGPAGWPLQVAAAAQEWVFLERCPLTAAEPVPDDDPHRDAQRVVAALADGAHLVAHSGGAVAALLAAAEVPTLVRSLTLFEPACLGVARGHRAVDSMVQSMTAVFDQAADPAVSDAEFTHLFMVAMGTQGADLTDPETATVGRRLRRSVPPWQVPLSLPVVGQVPTLVVTGGWSPAFDEVGDVLQAAGAQLTVVPGSGHGPQYHPDGHAAMTSFQRRLTA